MDAATIDVPANEAIVDNVLTMCLNQVQRWIESCYQFRRWERRHILDGNPDSQIKQKHKRALAQMIRGTRVMLNLASDPESSDPQTYRTLLTLSDQLERSWEMLYVPPSPEEAAECERLIAEIFPR